MAAPGIQFVPVRYVAAGPNVVPVETVLTNLAGTVPVRAVVGPANVMPVYETASVVPRLKVKAV